MDNKIILGGAALAALFLLSRKQQPCTLRFDIPAQYSPDGSVLSVCQEQLPQYGFVKYLGDWYHSSQFPPPNETGQGFDWAGWGQALQQAINAGTDVYAAIQTTINELTPQIIVVPDWNNGTVQYEFDMVFKKASGVAELDDYTTDFTSGIGWEVDTPFPGIMTFTIYRDGQPIKQKTVNFNLQSVVD